MRFLDGINRFFTQLLSIVMVVCLAIMVVMVFGNVVLRYGFNSGITISEEFSRWLFLWVIFMGATIAVRERSHMGTDLLVRLLPRLIQRLALLVGHLLMIYVTWLMLKGTWALYLLNIDVLSPVSEWSQGWVFASALLFTASTLWLFTLDFIKILFGQLDLDHIHANHMTDEDEGQAS